MSYAADSDYDAGTDPLVRTDNPPRADTATTVARTPDHPWPATHTLTAIEKDFLLRAFLYYSDVYTIRKMRALLPTQMEKFFPKR